jgi:hypothetical protein
VTRIQDCIFGPFLALFSLLLAQGAQKVCFNFSLLGVTSLVSQPVYVRSCYV